MAVRALPIWMRPVGDGAKRRTGAISAAIPKAIDDRIAPVAAEIAPGDLDAGRRLAALVLGHIEHVLDALHQCLGMAALDDISDRHLILDQTGEDVVERIIGG